MRSRLLCCSIVACLIAAAGCGDNSHQVPDASASGGASGDAGTGGSGAGGGAGGGPTGAGGVAGASGSGGHGDAATSDARDAAAGETPGADAGTGGAGAGVGGSGAGGAGTGGSPGSGGAVTGTGGTTPSCSDRIKNGDETDVDCGGGKCAQCAPGKGCRGGLDCTVGTCKADGTCGNCNVATDCPGVESECQYRTCTAGTCGAALVAQGTPVALQTGGDCKRRECDGAGAVFVVNDDTDLPDDHKPCTTDLCMAGVPSNVNVAAGTSCGGNNFCDGSGACIGCVVASDCPGTDSACRVRSCVQGLCGFASKTTCNENGGKLCDATGACVQCLADGDCDSSGDTACLKSRCRSGVCAPVPVAAGTKVGDPAPGDCHAVACDGAGSTAVQVDDSDVPVDGNACTRDVCTSGAPSNPAMAPGLACGGAGGGQRCDAAGACVPTFLVVRIGSGTSAALSSAATAVFVEERYSSDGGKAGEVALPVAASGRNNPFTLSGTGDSEGALALSGDGHFATLAGYVATPGTASVSGGSSPRVVARIDAAGAVDTSTSLGTTAFLGDNVRSAVTSDGSAFWIGGNSSAGGSSRGVFYTTLGAATSTLIESASKSTRVCQIVFGQLYCTSNSAPYMNVFAVGNGLPAVATPTLRSLTSDASASPFGFVLLDLAGGDGVPDTLYVADDRAPPSGGIQKWSLSGATWTQVGTINSGLQVGVRGLTGYAGGGGAVLIATTATASPVSNAIVRYSDASGTTPAMTTLQAASSGVPVFRGVALAPR